MNNLILYTVLSSPITVYHVSTYIYGFFKKDREKEILDRIIKIEDKLEYIIVSYNEKNKNVPQC